ncbi:discoidin domain-containing protein [Chryseobacterium sp. MP_3.2]|uniref:discoidin domain-containing protein n=1 Tax=Chryseobacterium sp. MP_3.2 TaxID=3071712 RepID=UPI002E0E0260
MKNFDLTSGSSSGFDKTYASAFTDNFKVILKNGLRDIYSLLLRDFSSGQFNLGNFGIFMQRFPNLYSFRLNFVENQNTILTGNIAEFPDSIERVFIENFRVKNNLTDAWLDLSGFSETSKLKFFLHQNQNTGQIVKLKTIGNVAKIPIGCVFFAFQNQTLNGLAPGCSISYSGTKVWANTFDTFHLPFTLKVSENNKMLTDMRSITSAFGGKLIKNTGWRNFESDADVLYLESLGFSVQIFRIPSDTKLNIRFIRSWSNGNNINNLNIWSDIKALRDSPNDNVAFEKIVKIYTAAGVFVANTSLVTDADNTSWYNGGATGLRYALLDLGEIFPIRQIIHKYYYEPGRFTNGSKIEVSEDGITWVVLYDSAISGTYLESASGTKYIHTF